MAMTMPEAFSGELAVVTSGASGLGAATARRLAELGTAVRIGDLTGAGAEKLDVRDREAVKRFFESMPRAPDVLITCAGGAKRAAALDVNEALLAETLQLNLGGFWRCAQEAARRALAEKTHLAIVHVVSSLHRGSAPQLSHFAAANAASVTMVRCLAQEWAVHHIRVNAVVPGPLETPATTPLWDARPGATVVGLVDPAPASDLAALPRFADLAAAIAKTTPDAVIVATPNDTHVGLARAAIDARLLVLCERPVRRTAADAEAIVSSGPWACPRPRPPSPWTRR
jgi:NAD(P)-dependent dehydrogenase (short-subunit alcohol dehydrogenase family)